MRLQRATAAHATYGNAFLPPIFQGTAIGKAGLPANELLIRNLGNKSATPEQQRKQFKLFREMNAEQVKRIYFAEGVGTKHALAEIIAQRFPAELGFRLPPQRRPWMSEDSRMDIFDAVALALAFRLAKEKRARSVVRRTSHIILWEEQLQRRLGDRQGRA